MSRLHPIFLLFLLSACIPPPDFPETAGCEGEDHRGIFILNEGVWTQNNASLDIWDGEVYCTGIFEKVNDRPLGDVANFALLEADTLFLVINNSRLLYKVQLPEMKLLASLSLPEGSAPREMIRISPERAFLTAFHTEKLYEFNPISMLLTDEIAVENSMEGILFHAGKLFVACGSHPLDGKNNKLAIIHPSNNEVHYLDLPVENPGDLAVFEENILVSCKGDFDPGGSGAALVVVHSQTEEVERVIPFKGSIFDIELVERQLLLITDSTIARLDMDSWELHADYLRKSQLSSDHKDLIYCMSYDRFSGELYVGIAPFGAVDGEVIRLDPFLRELERKKAGLYPGQILFYR